MKKITTLLIATVIIDISLNGIISSKDLKVKQKKYELTGKYYGYIIEKVKDKEVTER